MQFSSHSKVHCKHQYGGLNILNSSYRLKAVSNFSNTTIQSISKQTYIATPWSLPIYKLKNR